MEVSKYLLKHGEVLTKVTICYTNDLGVAEEMMSRQELSKFPRGSKTCQVELLELKSQVLEQLHPFSLCHGKGEARADTIHVNSGCPCK
ncbi:unnamed protein product [Prunus armeniaca]|uniref:FBD domain-containing protein n=1 Tax=Prunus armeniaca TaxID=36596 RepID=A0A6J5W1A9_PRUAR|nr:unnamed protein product [Prunus armeniaca]